MSTEPAKPSEAAAAQAHVLAGIKGMPDLFPAQTRRYRHLEEVARRLFEQFGYGEVRTPYIEPTELFARAAGDAADVVVSKQMYTFTDPGGRSNTLRPEGTAGVVRALVEDGWLKREGGQGRFFYVGPMFRYERPQKGRLRQFNQIGVELFGVAHPAADAEIVALCDMLLQRLGFQNAVTHINNIGCRDCRKDYNTLLREAILGPGGDGAGSGWCEQCIQRAQTNPMRVFDCKVESCKVLVAKLPRVSDYVCEACRTHFDRVLALLDAAGVRYERDRDLVRGFDYYSRTVFEVPMTEGLGAQSAVLGGGRYDYLVEELGGPATPAVGMAVGVERLLLAMEALGLGAEAEVAPELYILALDEAGVDAAFRIAQRARVAGRRVAFDPQPRSAKGGFKAAAKSGAPVALVIGEDEVARNVVQRKDLVSREQREVALTDDAALFGTA